MTEEWFSEREREIPKGEVRTRFAPSPTGYMHVGNLRTALYTWLIARHAGGKFILRIEDTDRARLVEDATEIIYKTLRECSLLWDEGPDIGGPAGPYVQSERREMYRLYAERLIELGGAYRCFCGKTLSEEDAGDFERGSDPCRFLSPEESRHRAEAGEPFVVRQKIPENREIVVDDTVYGIVRVDSSTLDDGVLLKRDGLPTYNFANVIDDHLMGITHVVRGSEYLSSCPKYNLLYESFGWNIPVYIHCPPVMRDAHNKMSKRHGDPSYEDLIGEGYLTQAVVNYVTLLGWSPRGEYAEREFFTLDELAEIFDIEAISKSPAIFDREKLNYFDAHYLRQMDSDTFYEQAGPYLKAAVKRDGVDLHLLASLVQGRCDKFSDIAPQVDFLDELPDYDTELYCHKKMKTDRENSLEALEIIRPLLSALPEWNENCVHDLLTKIAAERELKNGRIMWPIRTALSGKAVTPGGAVELCLLLGKQESLRRIDIGIEKLREVVS